MEDSKALIGVIIACYNQQEYLSETISSVINQTYENWECIIVDDGSTDDSRQIAEEWARKEPRISVISQPNLGPSAARNVGIASSNAAYIVPLDGDDILLESYLELAMAYLNSHPETNLVYSQAEKFGDQNGFWHLMDFNYQTLLSRNMIFSTSVIKREDVLAIGGYDEKMLDGYEDWELWIRLLNEQSIVYKIPKVCFRYRIRNTARNNSLVSNPERKKRVERYIYEKHKDRYRLFYPDIIEYIDTKFFLVPSLNYQLGYFRDIEKSFFGKFLLKVAKKISRL
jgi:glycosyltransferase involved in cell wall biosynthesis